MIETLFFYFAPPELSLWVFFPYVGFLLGSSNITNCHAIYFLSATELKHITWDMFCSVKSKQLNMNRCYIIYLTISKLHDDRYNSNALHIKYAVE